MFIPLRNVLRISASHPSGYVHRCRNYFDAEAPLDRLAGLFAMPGPKSHSGTLRNLQFEPRVVVDGVSQPLFAAEIPLCGLHRSMPEKKLDLL